MHRVAKLSLIILAASCALAPQAYADVSDIRATDKAVEISLGANELKYGETVGGSTFDTENGWDTNVAAEGRYLVGDQANWWILRNLYLSFDGSLALGDTDYKGGLQNTTTGAITPLTGTTNNDIVSLSAKAGHAFALFNQVMLIPFGDLGYHYWHRALTGVGSYSEDYVNGEAQGGLMVQYSPFPKWVFSALAEGGTTFGADMRTGGTQYDLGSKDIYNFEGKVGYTFTRYFEATGSLGFKGYGYGQSPVVNGGYEPNSYTHETTAMVGIAYHLP